ncbi:hypothetical protein BN946_scf184936.g23 [Trametes cinnabarina]|uniref:Uncharacterized protein n=1 Tax=Pycnoporus cinnabarinus TaxID=5643 RepID=A0A060SYG3_PYCCI|nr:hypothetical protein BN946_scf184936.g23 [Trametes cinnabarina]
MGKPYYHHLTHVIFLDSLLANIPPSISKINDSSDEARPIASSQSQNDAAQLPSPSPASSRPIPPLPRNLARKRRSPAAIESSAASHKSPFIPRTPVSQQKPQGVSPPSDHPAHTTASDESPHSPKRRRMSFATCAAQSSPMSTPSVASVPPSPVLSNMIVDAINAAGRINSRSPLDVSPSKRHVRSTELNATSNGRASGAKLGSGSVRPIPRRTSLGTSPTPSGPGRLLQRTSLNSAQAIEDALTQELSPAASPSPTSRSQLTSGSLQYPSPNDVTTSNHHGSQSPDSVASSSAQRSDGVDPAPVFSCTTRTGLHAGPPHNDSLSSHSQHPHGPSPSPPQISPPSAPPVKVIPPLPRRTRAQPNTLSTAVPPPATRMLRSRSKTPAPPAPAAVPATQSQTLQLPRRSTRSRTSSVTSAATLAVPAVADGEATTEDMKPKRARSRAPTGSEKPPAKGRARSRSQSRASATAGPVKKAGADRNKARDGGLPAVEEKPDDAPFEIDEEEEPKPLPSVLDNFAPSPSAYPPMPYPPTSANGSGGASRTGASSGSPNRFLSGTLYLDLPRRPRVQRSHSQSQSLQQQPLVPSQPSQTERAVAPSHSPQRAGIDKEVKRELIEATAADPSDGPGQSQNRDGRHGEHAGQARTSEASQPEPQSQSSESEYVEGYGFPMDSLVLQTQAPYTWSQDQSQ